MTQLTPRNLGSAHERWCNRISARRPGHWPCWSKRSAIARRAAAAKPRKQLDDTWRTGKHGGDALNAPLLARPSPAYNHPRMSVIEIRGLQKSYRVYQK